MDRTPSSPPSPESPRSLRWGVKASLVAYVTDMSDGSATVEAPALADGDTFVFPESGSATPLQFRGTVTLSGHAGMLRLVFADPALEETAGGWTLTIADPHEAGGRLPFAAIAELTQTRDGGRRGTGLRLTEAGADLFFSGPYTAGTELDDFEVRTAAGRP
ncbi:HtaA domain-containing protein [Leucobacter chromiireducens]|uniref:HtaA domain-containing protein n=1 Tax=Leucobacter chromiireducens TaxID=283877 RepID=UPI000F638F77|nr:HtaA domain-containing protein [Leucobacter chromiireducens]